MESFNLYYFVSGMPMVLFVLPSLWHKAGVSYLHTFQTQWRRSGKTVLGVLKQDIGNRGSSVMPHAWDTFCPRNLFHLAHGLCSM